MRHITAAAATLRMTTPTAVDTVVICYTNKSSQNQQNKINKTKRKRTHHIKRQSLRRRNVLVPKSPHDRALQRISSNRRLLRPRKTRRSPRFPMDTRLGRLELVYTPTTRVLQVQRIRIRIGRVILMGTTTTTTITIVGGGIRIGVGVGVGMVIARVVRDRRGIREEG